MADLIVQTNLVGYVLNAETDHDLGAIQEFGDFDTMFGGSTHHYRRHAALGGRLTSHA